MSETLYSRLQRAAAHCEPRSPRLAALLLEAAEYIEQHVMVSTLKAERDVLKRHRPMISYLLDSIDDELIDISNLIVELETQNESVDDRASDAGVESGASPAPDSE